MVKKYMLGLMLVIFSCTIYAQKTTHKKESEHNVKELFISWLDAQGKQKEALLKLSIMYNRGELIDLPRKKDIFEILIKNSKEDYFLHQSILFLSKFEKNDDVLQQCKSYIYSNNNCNEKALLASLTYASVHEIVDFNQFFADKEYLSIGEQLRIMFSHTSVIKDKRDDFFRQAITNLSKQKSNLEIKSKIMDAQDQNYQLLLKEATYIPDFVNEHKELYMTPSLSLEILYLLGEIHSFESFDVLLDNYLIEPNFRSAITLACCTGSLQVEKLFTVLKSKYLLDKFLKDILMNISGNYWGKMSNLSFEGKLNFYKDNYEQILINVRQRAKPILG